MIRIYAYGSIAAGGDYVYIDGSTMLDSGQWHHLVLLYSAADINMANLNGIDLLINNVADSLTLVTASGNGILSGIQDGPSPFGVGVTLQPNDTVSNPAIWYDGAFDDLRMYDRILTLAEVDSLYNEVDTPMVNVSKQILMNVQLYSNPAGELLNVEILNSKNVTAGIYSSSGNLVKSAVFTEPERAVDISALAPGLYFMVFWEGEKSWTGRFIRE